MEITPDRVISVPLSEEDWRVFVAAEREPVQWLKEQIARSIARARDDDGTPGHAPARGSYGAHPAGS